MFDLATIKKILKILNLSTLKHKQNLTYLILFVILSSIIEVISVYLIIPVYKVIINNESLNDLIPWVNSIFNISFNTSNQEQLFALSFFAFIFILSNSLKIFITWQAGKETGKIGAYLFGKAYSNILLKPYEFLSSENLSKYSSNFLTTNTYFVNVLKNIIILTGFLTTSIILVFTLLILNPGATSFALLFLVLPYLIILKITKPYFYKISKQISFQIEDINRYLLEAFKSLKTIQHFEVQKYYTQVFYKQESKLREKAALGEFLEGFPRNFLEALGLTMLTILFGSSVLLKAIDVPAYFIIALIFSCQKLLPSLQQIYRIYVYILSYSFSVNDLFDLLHQKEINKVEIKFIKDTIKFENVSFGFFDKNKNLDRNFEKEDSKEFIIKNVNLEFKFPASIAITGDSGCGKTTFVDLLTGLLTPSKGNIFLPRHFKKPKSIGYVPQEVPILNATISENLCLGNKELMRDKIYLTKCLKLTGLTRIIEKLPSGLNTILGEQAINLSGGQKQRLGIARALLIKPKVLILDESTNALDSKSENKIIDYLISEFKESLIIFITHNKNIKNKCKHNIFLKNNGEMIFQEKIKRE